MQPANLDKAGCTCFTVTLLQGYKHFENSPHILRTTNEKALIPEEDKNAALDNQEPVVVTPLYNKNGDKPYTILIIEDNAELRSLLSTNFQSTYQVLEAANGKEGWQTAVEQLPDMIISDVMMPEMDGFTICAQLKTDERTSHIPVILLTAKSAQTDQAQGLETGADVYITKPFSTKIVALQVRNLLAARERMRQKFGQQIIEEKNAPNSISVPTVNDVVVNTTDAEFIQKVIQLVEEHMDNPAFGVDMLAKKVAMSQPVLYKKLKAVTNMSVNDFVKTLRLKKAAQLLKQKQFTVYEVAYAVGYQDRKYFSREFKKQFGNTPSEYADLEEIEES